MAATISSSPRDHSSPLESEGTFSSGYARSLVADYKTNELAGDSTSKILFAFLDHLPPDGQCNVWDDISEARDDLRGLADHYVSNILVPSMFSPVIFELHSLCLQLEQSEPAVVRHPQHSQLRVLPL